MSELSVRQYLHNDGSGLTLGYDKSEADEVIAELEKKLDIYKRGWMENDRVNANQYTEIRHHKYKRCLAMALWCNACLYQFPSFGTPSKKEKWWSKWHDKWLDIAEKFKEGRR